METEAQRHYVTCSRSLVNGNRNERKQVYKAPKSYPSHEHTTSELPCPKPTPSFLSRAPPGQLSHSVCSPLARLLYRLLLPATEVSKLRIPPCVWDHPESAPRPSRETWGSRETDWKDLPAALWAMKSFVSGPGVSCVLPASVKPQQAHSFLCKGKISESSLFVAWSSVACQ